MAQVATQEQLQTALNLQDNLIQVVSFFSISSQIIIRYDVTLESLTPDTPAVLSKDSSYFGYLFRVTEGGSLTIRNLILDGEKDSHPSENTNNRSLIFVTGGTLSLFDGTIIRNNNATLEGGGIYLNSTINTANQLILSGNTKVIGCQSKTSGGGLMIASNNPQDSYSITDQVLIDSNSANNGGGIYIRSYVPEAGCNLTLGSQVQITNNNASNTGGGIIFSGYRNGMGLPSSLTLNSTVLISGNHAQHGGGVAFYAMNSGDKLILSGTTTITNNTALQNGGGCYYYAQGVTADFTMENTKLTNNTGGTGGGLYLLTDSGGTIRFAQNTISSNTAGNGSSGSGGGVWIQNQSQNTGLTVSSSNDIWENNHSTANGGAFSLTGGSGAFSLQLDQDTISGNTCEQNGGGLLISNTDAGKLVFHQTTLSNNSARGSGGGLYYANLSSAVTSDFAITDSIITNNIAGLEGGGLRIASGNGFLTTTLTDTTISSNTAKNNSGGGIWNGGANNTLTLFGSTVVSDNSSEAGNGGGIYFNSDDGLILLTDMVKVTNNHADAVSSSFGNHGGGICLVPGILTIQGQAEIALNYAGKYGGGISAAEESQIVMEGGSIHDNHSNEFGGGIWNHGDSTVTLLNGSLSNNQAPYGAGIYNDSTLYVEGERNLTDGIYIQNAAAIVRLEHALTGNSLIQLENSNYVIPNQEGLPILVGESTPSYPVLSLSDSEAFRKPLQGFDGWEIRLNENNTQILLAPVTYTIDYQNLLGAKHSNPISYTVTTPDIYLLAPQQLPGYHFIGWFTALEGGTQITVISQGTMGDITLYARWETITKDYVITFKGNDNCCLKAWRIPEPITVLANQSVILPDNIPCRRCYCFQSWNTNPCGCGTQYLPGEQIPSLTQDLTLYAIWRRQRYRENGNYVR